MTYRFGILSLLGEKDCKNRFHAKTETGLDLWEFVFNPVSNLPGKAKTSLTGAPRENVFFGDGVSVESGSPEKRATKKKNSLCGVGAGCLRTCLCDERV